MAAKAVVVFDPSGNPLINVECILVIPNSTGVANYNFPLTNQDGYAISPLGWSNNIGYLKVTANGFKSYLQLVTLDDQNQEIHINAPGGPSNTIHLPSLSFNQPSRDRILNVKANLCNVLDATGLPIFEPFISTLFETDINRANDWISRLKGNGSTHITVELTGDYDEYLSWLGGRYPIIGLDYTNNIDGFKRFLEFILGNDLIPIIKSGADGQEYQPGGKTYGWQWGIYNLPRIYSLLVDYRLSALWSTGYDGCFPDWSPDQLLQFLKMMRESLGTDACIDTEFGSGPNESISYCHLGKGSADWTDDKLGDLDSFSVELQTNPAQSDGMIQVFERIGPNGIYRHNDKTIVHMYETVAYWAIRKEAIQNANSVANQAYDVGFRTFGNGLPL